MAGVRNGCLARIRSAAAGYITLFAVPAGFVVLLKDLRVYNDSQAAHEARGIALVPDGSAIAVLFAENVSALEQHAWEGWIALNPGDRLQVYAAGAGLHFWASGAMLPGEAEGLPLPSSSADPA